MPIRLSGMNSGMDTDAIVAELVKAKSTKKETLKKDQKKFSWKQDAWKALNTKIYNLYSKTLDNLRLSGSYSKRTATVSNANVASVIAGNKAVNSTQRLAVKKLAQTGYLTGEKLEGDAPYKADTKLSEMGITFGTDEVKSITVMADGVATKVNITAETTIEQFTADLGRAGVNANFDEKNQRFFISSKKIGKDGDFSLLATSADSDSENVLLKLGIKSSLASDTNTRALYETLVAVKGSSREETINNLKNSDNPDYAKANYILQTTALSQAKKYQASVTSLEKELEKHNEQLAKQNEELSRIQAEKEKITDPEEGAAALAALEAEEAKITEDKTNLEVEIARLEEQRDTEITYFSTDEDGVVSATDILIDKVADSLVETIDYAETALEDNLPSSTDATRIIGRDSEISLNGATFTSTSNTYEINGLTITAKQETGDEEVVITTADDTDGIYNMIKGFLKEYNELINEMDKLYNADSARKYTMLSDEEKEAMSEDEVKDWETKIKDALLRKDSTLSTVSSAMKQIMLAGVKMGNGKMAYLSDFGINTLSYLTAPKNETSAYHIDGDEEDTNTAGQPDKLKGLIASDPEYVTEFFTSLSKNLYSRLSDLMASSEYSSAYTVYNDKQMKKEYDEYTKKVSAQERLVADYEDRYYKKFTAMEKAMAKMNSQQSALSSLFGGQ